MLKLYKSRKSFHKIFIINQQSLQKILGDFCVIEHVGSTAVSGVGGKGIIDILIGLEDDRQIDEAVKKLVNNGYFSGRNSQGRRDYVFLASTEEDTTLGDTHLHLVLKKSKDFKDFIKVRDFLRQNPEEAKKYSELKYKIAKETGYNREEYKRQKSKLVETILKAVN